MLRVWPGVVAVVLQWLLWFALPAAVPAVGAYGLIGGMLMTVVIATWWLFFSRVQWIERIAALLLMAASLPLLSRIVHPSIANGMMGMMVRVYSLPVFCLALVAWAVATRTLTATARRAALVVAVAAACGAMTLVRTFGVSGDGGADLHWRWTKTPEERLLASAADDTPPVARLPVATPPATAAPAPTPATSHMPSTAASTPHPIATAEATKRPASPAAAVRPTIDAAWPGFRGPRRDDVIRGVRLQTDWSTAPPANLWRKPIGPGWSSFAVRGDLVYTQEQRGDHEMVSAYRLATGEPVWRHRDAARFYESNAGPGPRATPTVAGDRVYTFGATGIVNALDADTGKVLWSRDAAADTGAKTPGWGFASSPQIVGDLVVVAASGRLIAYEAAGGKPRWQAPTQGVSYSSPHYATLRGVPQIVLLTSAGPFGISPADGKVLWQHPWEGTPMLQPARIDDGDLLIAMGDMMGGMGIRRLGVAQSPDGWTVEERWTSKGLKPYFNDFIVHKGHAYGFDGSILSCIDLADGQRKWKGGRFGHGQLMLLADQDVLLILSEEGELAMVKALPERYEELARSPAIEGKTWNHHVLVGDVVLVRNGEEMAAYRVPLAR